MWFLWLFRFSIYSENSPIVILEEKTGERIPYFLELDAREEKREDKSLIIRPVKRLKDGESYIVAARNLKNIFGENIQPDPGFLALRDGLASDIRGIHKQRNLYLSGVYRYCL